MNVGYKTIMKSSPLLLLVASHFFVLSMSGDSTNEGTSTSENTHSNDTKKVRSLLTPRMDYEQWKPVGRGDPLKNDPTYDYVPPVLERVHYWIEPTLRKPDPPLHAENRKTEILLLGGIALKKNRSSSGGEHKPSFVKFTQPKIARPQLLPLYFPGKYFSNKITPEYSTVRNKHAVPSSVLVPPPITSKDSGDYQYIPLTSTMYTTTPSSVTVQEANLIYTTSALITGNKFKEKLKTHPLTNPSGLFTSKTTTLQSLTVPQEIYTEHNNHLSDGDKKIKFPRPESYIEIEFPTLPKNETTATKKEEFLNYVTSPKETDVVNAATSSYSVVKIPEELLVSQLLPPVTPQRLLQTMQPPPMPTTLQNLHNSDPFISSESKLSFVSTTTAPPETITTTSLTTDPLFKHYKQPTGPLTGGPMYLIIQGHSKVKNFGPGKNTHGIPLQEVNDVLTPDDDKYSVKHLHNTERKKPIEKDTRKGRSGELQTLSHVIQTGWGAIDFPEVAETRRRDYDVKEIELGVKYDVSAPPPTDTPY